MCGLLRSGNVVSLSFLSPLKEWRVKTSTVYYWTVNGVLRETLSYQMSWV